MRGRVVRRLDTVVRPRDHPAALSNEHRADRHLALGARQPRLIQRDPHESAIRRPIAGVDASRRPQRPSTTSPRRMQERRLECPGRTDADVHGSGGLGAHDTTEREPAVSCRASRG